MSGRSEGNSWVVLLLVGLELLTMRDAACAGSASNILITEFNYHPGWFECTERTFGREEKPSEWIEISNTSDEPFDLSEYSIEGGICFVFPHTSCIPAHESIIVAKDPDAFVRDRAEYCGFVYGPYDGKLGNSGDAIQLTDRGLDVVDAVEYDDVYPWPELADGYGYSLERRLSNLALPAIEQWRLSAIKGGTPGWHEEDDAEERSHFQISTPRVEGTRGSFGYSTSKPIRISFDIASAHSVVEANLFVQKVFAGSYLRSSDEAFASRWERVPCIEDCKAEKRFSFFGSIDPLPQRSLLRWKIQAIDATGRETWYPSQDSPRINEALFFYESLPDCEEDNEPPAAKRNPDSAFEWCGPDTAVPVYFLIAERAEITALLTQYPKLSASNRYLVEGTFVAEGKVYDHIKIRLRGGTDRFASKKRSLKLEFPRNDLFCGQESPTGRGSYPRRHINLNACRDFFGLQEAVAYKLFETAGVTTPRVQFVQLRIVRGQNELDCEFGDYYGLYLDVEEIGERFLRQRGLQGSLLFEMRGTAVPRGKTGRAKGILSSALKPEEHSFQGSELAKRLNIEKYLAFRAAANVSQCYDLGMHNYMLLLNSQTAMWELVPCDLNSCFGLKDVERGDLFSRRSISAAECESLQLAVKTLLNCTSSDQWWIEWDCLEEFIVPDSQRWGQGIGIMRAPGVASIKNMLKRRLAQNTRP